MKIRHRISIWARWTAAPLLVCASSLTGCGASGGGGDLEPWRGSLAEGLAAIEALATEQRFD